MGFFDDITDFINPIKSISSTVAPFLDFAGGMFKNSASASEAERGRDWSTYMSNTAHQREVQDLRAAGLNPILSANHGASTPSSAIASFDNPFSGFGKDTNDSISTDLQKNINTAQKALLEDQASQARSQAEANATQANLNRDTMRLTQANTAKVDQEREELLPLQKLLLKSQTFREASQAGVNSALAAESISRKIGQDIDNEVKDSTKNIDKVLNPAGKGARTVRDVLESIPTTRKYQRIPYLP